MIDGPGGRLGWCPGHLGEGERSVRETVGSNGILSLFIRWRGLFSSRVALTEATVSSWWLDSRTGS